MATYYPGIERDAVDYIKLQQRQRELLDELRRERPTLFNRMMKAGLFAILGAFGASLAEKDPATGAALGALISMYTTRKTPQGQLPTIPAPPYRMGIE